MTHYLFLVPLALIVAGVALYQPPAALIVAGVLLAVWWYYAPVTGGDEDGTRR